MAEQNVFNLMQNDEIGLLWKKIYRLHQKTKIYLLTAEEIYRKLGMSIDSAIKRAPGCI